VWLLRAGPEQEKGEIVMLTIELNMYHAVALGALNRVEPFIFRISNDKKHSKM